MVHIREKKKDTAEDSAISSVCNPPRWALGVGVCDCDRITHSPVARLCQMEEAKGLCRGS